METEAYEFQIFLGLIWVIGYNFPREAQATG
jgi:hypothetical protein